MQQNRDPDDVLVKGTGLIKGFGSHNSISGSGKSLEKQTAGGGGFMRPEEQRLFDTSKRNILAISRQVSSGSISNRDGN